MGLDTTLYKLEMKPKLEEIYDKLAGGEMAFGKVFYWRNNHNLLDWFRKELGGVNNGEYHEITKDSLINWLHDLKTQELTYYDDYEEDLDDEMKKNIIMITKLLKETDFKKTKFYFYNWW